jgi:hypothetical protein
MSVEDIDVLHSEIPELFQSRDLSPTWDDSLIIVPINEPEAQFADSSVPIAKWDPEFLNYQILENLAADPMPEVVEPPLISPEILDALGGAHPGAPASRIDLHKMPPPDCFAYYLPFHYYHPTQTSIPRHPRDLGPGLMRKILHEVGLSMSLEQFMQQ